MELAHNNDVPSNVNFLGQLHFLTSSAFLRPFRCVGIIYMLSQLSGLLIINVYTLTYLSRGIAVQLFLHIELHHYLALYFSQNHYFLAGGLWKYCGFFIQG